MIQEKIVKKLDIKQFIIFADTLTEYNARSHNTLNVHNLKMIQININLIVSNNRKHDLQDMLRSRKSGMSLSEKELNSSYFVKLKNYKFVRENKRNAKQGGVKRTKIKFAIVGIKIARNTSFFIISVYATGSAKTKFTNEIDVLL